MTVRCRWVGCASGGALAVAALLAAGCRTRVVPSDEQAAFTPGLGEIMGQNQVRHAKLWFAGRAGNWALASYELDELGEGFADAVRYHPTHKTAAESLTTTVPGFMNPPLTRLRQVVARHDSAAFPAAFDALTAGCNGCHAATGFGFNVVQRPTTAPFSNQGFAPPAPSHPRPAAAAARGGP